MTTDLVVDLFAGPGGFDSFPPDYPWQGAKSSQYQQVGNAVPPLLASRIVAPLIASRDIAGRWAA